jgi:hypothetical protein
MQTLSFIFLAIFSFVLIGCQQDTKTGIRGNNNSDNQVAITDKGDININKGNININEKPETIPETGIIPEDILTKLNPGVSLEYTRQLLGEPNVHENLLKEANGEFVPSEQEMFVWRFKNAFIAILSEGGKSIDGITLLKKSMEQPDKFKIYPLDYELGALEYSNISNECEPPKINAGAKQYYVFTKCYFGFPGKYWNFEFGLFEGGGVFYGEPSKANINGNINTGPFNYVSIGHDEAKIFPIAWNYLF